MNIGFDIDGVLTDFEAYIYECGKKYFNMNAENFKDFNVINIFDMREKIEINLWNQLIKNYATMCPARDGAADVVKKLRKEGHKIYIITNRCYDMSYCDISAEVMRVYVKSWLEKENIEYDKLIFNMTESKLNSCLSCKLDIMIEDMLENIEDLHSYIQMICFRTSYNKNSNIENLLYCNNMTELYKIIKEIDIS